MFESIKVENLNTALSDCIESCDILASESTISPDSVSDMARDSYTVFLLDGGAAVDTVELNQLVLAHYGLVAA